MKNPTQFASASKEYVSTTRYKSVMQRWPAGEPSSVELISTSGTEGDTSSSAEFVMPTN